MQYIKFLALGILFGVTLAKAEIISWFRIYEMFRFESFHMYGVIGSAVILGALLVQLIKRTGLNDIKDAPIKFSPKNMSITRYLAGGTFFGLGWALVGACPGPMFILIGFGYYALLIVLFGAIMGTFAYGLLRDKLPH